ncbi:methyltransferase family protein [Mycobacterium spongiae]|uniref:Isoprenylcysteine carboxylmethyltransferase family protein n=1 Tax=Mycobacterium spongiae TaxID=886343 RepID=A0A975JZE9_9MYCO|nr:isoprenylcysteine carboxylmethyltransferase family protein [Mycobacterium spongiae]QUR68536.1 isoprenylcysteine carboxylmethyltransferase family protein [Mycobacterium spongiae]
MKTGLRAALSSVVGLVILGVALFLSAGTLNYWQAWVFIAVFAFGTIISSRYLARTAPAALQRRKRGGPRAETRMVQKFIVTAALLGGLTMMAFSAIDHRFRWSSVPTAVSLVGVVAIAAGLGMMTLVIVQNHYAAATVTVETGQKVATHGLYRFVRHPMYAANVIMMVGVPLALGSYWGLFLLIPVILALVFRILDEETLLTQELAGYREYTQRVRYRLIPYVW